LTQFSQKADQLEPLVMMRARHVISENERTLQAKEAMLQGNAKKLGQLMNESHISMRDDFEITNQALNVIVDCAQAHEACFGARMTGGGFGGCAVAIIREDAVDEFVQYVYWCFHDQTRLEAKIYVCKATNGAEIVDQT
jgi:galactokinase